MRYWSLALVIAAASLSNATADEVYKWKDKNGVVHYGEFEPPNRKSTTIETPSSKPAPGEGESETDGTPSETTPKESELNQKKKKLENMNEDRAKKKDAKAKSDDQAKAMEQRCNALKSRLAVLERGGRMSEGRPDGKVHYLTDDEVKGRIAETRKIIDKDCKNN